MQYSNLKIIKIFDIIYLQGKENTLYRTFKKNKKKCLTILKKYDIIFIESQERA